MITETVIDEADDEKCREEYRNIDEIPIDIQNISVNKTTIPV